MELGSFQVSGQEHIADLRPIFSARPFLGLDMRQGRGVDCRADGGALPFADQSAGTFLMLDTLEHVWDLQSIFDEAFRVLKPGGLLVLSTVMNFPIHDYPSDYWRFTPEAIRLLLHRFSDQWVGSMGRADFPHTVLAVALKPGGMDAIGHFKELTAILENHFHPDPETRPKSSDRSALDRLKRDFKNLAPASWPEIQTHILEETFRRFEVESSSCRCGVLCPELKGIANPFKHCPNRKEAVFFFDPESDIKPLPDFSYPIQRLFLPMTFHYIRNTENLLNWIIRNTENDADVVAAMPNMAFLPLLVRLIEGHFSPGRHGMTGPLMDAEAWLNYFNEQLNTNVILQWNPTASLLAVDSLPKAAHCLSPSFILEFNLPDGDDHIK